MLNHRKVPYQLYLFETDSSVQRCKLPLHLSIGVLDGKPAFTAEVVRTSSVDVSNDDTAQVPAGKVTGVIVPDLDLEKMSEAVGKAVGSKQKKHLYSSSGFCDVLIYLTILL